MNLFLNIYNSKTVYEWILLGSCLFTIYLLTILVTYLLTKKWNFALPILITYPISALLYILSIYIVQLIPNILVTEIFSIPIFIIILLLSVNWITFISYYTKYKNSKKFSLSQLVVENKEDTVRNIIFLTVAVLPVSIFLRNSLLAVVIISYLITSVTIYINSILIKRFVHD
jgi:hypothetical protein